MATSIKRALFASTSKLAAFAGKVSNPAVNDIHTKIHPNRFIRIPPDHSGTTYEEDSGIIQADKNKHVIARAFMPVAIRIPLQSWLGRTDYHVGRLDADLLVMTLSFMAI